MIPGCNSCWWGPEEAEPPPGRGDPLLLLSLLINNLTPCVGTALVLLFANLFPSAFPSEGGLYAFLFTWLQVKRVALDLFNNVFLLNLALETAQRVLEGFTLLQSNFCQTNTPPNPSGRTE